MSGCLCRDRRPADRARLPDAQAALRRLAYGFGLTAVILFSRHLPCARSFGGEDCVAAQITLAGSSGDGLRRVESADALW